MDRWSSQRGAALLMVLVMVVILGLAAAKTGQSWRAVMQMEREQELLWRGQQYLRAIESYYTVKHGAQNMFPLKLDELLRDPRFPGVVRHLRKLYTDPMTGDDWTLIKDPAERIIGVRPTSDLTPFKQDGFPLELTDLKGKGAYREWEFVYQPPKSQSRSAKETKPNDPTPAGGSTPAAGTKP
ncbi:MAG: type II secretion system protein [Deltaproteobacteria bacterium]|nr:type II secretion system protein [Deltaproteobacteria bacterium]